MKREVLVCDHQSTIPVPHGWLVVLETAGVKAASEIETRFVTGDASPLVELKEVDVALVDDAESSRVHRDFMGIDGATDVITFEHGEIVIGVEVAKRQAAEYGEPELRELLRYLVHGLLHLAGHEDESDEDRVVMEEAQETLVRELWPEVEERI
ncbi:rRNA maturation RNase YbeY [Haloferula luteola]|uniref:Endoribonuclease YbeY n=1 Tax=Haloferula luteola TaxID=595692 RepID=A0A840VGV1_9BACT|nr:rRNA maturation RNase YbeY [Haloferula luteola]MBB5353818.1 rRNA maturation RNase YbeY [Haloferula luteola]